ncbi:MAG: SUF system NifU family Fe-S cluster assembly protein [Herminiimonas sp.]|nr:SUF system NifU family Fe-S cluster assembly protein [Herminiimonas sp.]
MTGDMKALYQEVILDHNRKPRNFGPLDQASHRAEGHNPLCGDHLSVALGMEGQTIDRIAFEGESCAICKASASMMTVAVKGKALPQVQVLIHEFLAMATGKLDLDGPHQIGRLAVFSGVRNLPTRVKCAILPWHTLQAAIDSKAWVSTETDTNPSPDRTDTP